MRPTIVLLTILTFFAAGCSNIYRIQIDHLKRGEARWMKVPQPIAIPAYKDGRKTYIDMAYVRYVTKKHPGTDDVA